MVKIGFCVGLNDHQNIRALAEIGAEFVELNFTTVSQASEEQIAACAALLHELNLPVLSYNCMLPWDLRVNGENRDFARADRYFAQTFRRLAPLGGKNVVFGSGRSRALDGDNTRENAYAEMTKFLQSHVAPAFALHGFTCSIEPLSECALVHTAEDGMELVESTARREVGLLLDFYHTAANGEDMSDLSRFKDCLYHTHIAALEGRAFPKATDPDDYIAIFRALDAIGYTGGISVEASLPAGADYATAAREAYATLVSAREAAKQA